MKNLAIILGFVGAILFLSSFQAKAEEPQGKITGTLKTVDTNETISFANISLLNKNKETINGCMSDENGNFTFCHLQFGEYDLKITCLGYKPTVKHIHIQANSPSIELGSIPLSQTVEQLNEVEIAEERLKGKQEVDKTVFTINETIQNSSTDGMDVLRYIPGVIVDFQENVSIDGSANILYLVNGVKRDKNFVAQLHPDDFNKVEIITNPGVKYDADIDAVINIVTKAHSRGGRGGITLQGSNPKSFIGNENANLEYGNENFRVFVKERLHFEQFPAGSYSTTQIINNLDTLSLSEEGLGDASWLNNNLNYGFDWFINEKNIINLYGEYFTHKTNNSDYLFHGIQTQNGNVISEYDMVLDKSEKRNRLFNSLFYKHNFKKEGEYFSSQINHYTYHGEAQNLYDYTYLNHPESNTYSLRHEDINNNKQMLEWKNDYSQNIGKIKLDAGAWSYFQWFNNSYNLNYETTKAFNYQEFRQDAYINAAGMLKKLRYSGGLRIAYSQSDIDNTEINEYTELLPQISLQYLINKNSSLRFSGRRRITRPTIDQLNPFGLQANAMEVQSGNPDLKPELLNRFELQYALNFGSNYIAPKLYLDYSTNSIQHNFHINEDGISVLRPENVGQRYEYGIDLAGAIVLGKLFRITPSITLFNAKLAGPNGYEDELLSFRTNSTIIITPFKSKDFSFMAIARYQTPRLQYKSVVRRDPLYFIGATAKLAKNLKASAYFAPTIGGFTYHEFEITDEGYNMLSTNIIESQCLFAFNIVYQFNWGKEPRTLNRDTNYERDGGGGTM